MTKNFKVRLSVSLMLLAISSLFLFTLNGVPFKIFYFVFATVALIELLSFFKRKKSIINIILGLLESAFLVFSSIFILKLTVVETVLLIFGVCGYDVFAYLFGKAIGGSIFKNLRPFPHISKNKTFEGTIMGLISSFVLVSTVLLITNSYEYMFLLAGPFAVIGDLFESMLKRTFRVKDSNENVITNNMFKKIELLIGGSEGHGGYLDRIDSLAFTGSILLFIIFF